ncbi:acylphosphatase [Kaarinaea lacus]
MSQCIKCLVYGKVQGVWYRGNTLTQALELGLVGYAKNLSDGRVEVLACGDQNQLKAFKDWLWHGPKLAQVDDVKCEPVNCNPLPVDFSIG